MSSPFSLVWKVLVAFSLLMQLYLLLRLNGVLGPTELQLHFGGTSPNTGMERNVPLVSTGRPKQPAEQQQQQQHGAHIPKKPHGTRRSRRTFKTKAPRGQALNIKPKPKMSAQELRVVRPVKNGDGQCKPVTRFVYIKTHKSGSSTLTNIFHRFATNRNISVALPKGNYFLGWPISERIPTSYVKEGVAPPEIWCSAHTRHDYTLLNQAIPNAVFVTVLRNPVSHFLSSWNYWNTPQHIQDGHPEHKRPTVEEFLEDPKSWWKYGKKSDKDLLENNAAFDLGLNMNSTHADVEALIAHMEEKFGMVLITEYMDESLVLLKRRFCWDLDEVLYYGLKVTGARKKRTLAPLVQERIRKIDWMDVMLHDHFNKSLWRAIEQERKSGFDDELAEFRRRMAVVSDTCSPWQDWSEDMHRQMLVEKPASQSERMCHMTLLDSPGYVRFLKELQGIPDTECRTQGNPRRHVVFIKTHKTGGSTIANIMHRLAIRLGLNVVLPKNNYFLGWPQLEGLPDSYTPLPNTKKPLDMLCSAHARLHFPTMNKLVPDAVYVTILRDPVKHFRSSWNYWHISDHIFAKTGKHVTMEDFLADTDGHWSDLSDPDKNVLHNSMSFDLGLSHTPSVADVEELIKTLHNQFALTMITDYMDESLVLLRRALCWQLEDMVNIPLKRGAPTNDGPVSPEAALQIRKLNWADAMLFDALNHTFWERIFYEVHFPEELQKFRELNAASVESCAVYPPDHDLKYRKDLLAARLRPPTPEALCKMQQLDSPGFVKLLKRRADIVEPECHTQGRKRSKVVFLKTHKTGGSTLLNVFHRFALENKARLVLPKDNMFFGWPTTDIESSVHHYGNPTYDMFVSGHARYDYNYINKIVPNAQYFTILRDPVAHFLSSWHHWHVADHITANGHTAPTIAEFLKEPNVWLDRAKWTDPILVHNSMSYDLGLSNDPTDEQIDNLIAHMSSTFTLVMITEMFDESLVMLRRDLCWSMEDITFLSLKVTPDESRVVTDAAVLESIRQFNKADVRLYEYFKARLVQRLSEEIEVDEEVAQLRQMQETVKAQCAAFDEYEEDRLRKALLDPATDAQTRKCLLMRIDSKGFLKYTKSQMGIDFPECSSSNTLPLTDVAMYTFNTHAENILSNAPLRYALAHHLNIIVPKPGSTRVSVSSNNYTVLGAAKDRTPSMLVSVPFVRETPLQLRRVLRNVRVAMVIQEPVSRFVSAWDLLGVSAALAAANGGTAVSMKTFLASPAQYLEKLGSTLHAELINPVSARVAPSPIATDRTAEALTKAVYESADFFLVVEMMDESLVALRRWLCWGADDVAFSTRALQTLQAPQHELTSEERMTIETLNWADMAVYTNLRDGFKHHLEGLVGFEAELAALRERRADMDTKCGGVDLATRVLRVQAALQAGTAVDPCDVAALDNDEFTELFRSINSQ